MNPILLNAIKLFWYLLTLKINQHYLKDRWFTLAFEYIFIVKTTELILIWNDRLG